MVLPLFPIIVLQALGELNELIALQYLASILGGVLHFVPVKMYWLPEAIRLVGFREDSLVGSGLHYYEFYPLDESKAITPKSIKWNIGL